MLHRLFCLALLGGCAGSSISDTSVPRDAQAAWLADELIEAQCELQAQCAGEAIPSNDCIDRYARREDCDLDEYWANECLRELADSVCVDGDYERPESCDMAWECTGGETELGADPNELTPGVSQ